MLSNNTSLQHERTSHTTTKTFKWIITFIIIICFSTLLYGSASLLPLLKATLFVLEPTIPTASVFFFLCVAVTNPCSIGYAVIVLSCGAVFGWSGFIIVYIGSIVGATFWFSVFRICTTRFDCQINRVIGYCCACFNHSENTELTLRTIDLALSTHPVRSAALVQLTFLPFGSVVSLLASTQIDLLPFIAACCISRLKLINYIWLARSAVTALSGDENKEFHLRDFASLIVSLSFSVVSLAIIAYYAKLKLSQLHTLEDDHEHVASGDDSFGSSSIDEHRVDIEPRMRKLSGNRGPLSPTSIATFASQSSNQPDSFDSHSNDEYASLLVRPTNLRHSMSNPLNLHVSETSHEDIQASNEQVLAAIASAMSPTRKYRVSIGSYQHQSVNPSPRQRINSNASPTNAHMQHR